MLTWINFLHIYQPPTQSKEIVDLVVRESYAKIPELLKKYPKVRFTMNIAGSLIELFEKYGYTYLIEEYKKLAEEGRIEFVGSAMYHPLLALLPESEIRRQIELHNEISKKYFGDAYKPKGFFIPEMAYSKKVAEIIKDMGFEWIILDEMHADISADIQSKINPEIKYVIKDVGLSVVFRDRLFSKTFSPEFIIENREKIKNEYIIIAHDGELYGHWHKDDKGYYEKAFNNPDINFLTISEYLKNLSENNDERDEKIKEINVREASWESLHEELALGIPFALWKNPNNKIHIDLWKFAEGVMKVVEENTKDPGYSSARKNLDQGLASCAWWWATGAKLVSTSPVCWNPTEVEKGLTKLLEAIQALKDLPSDERHIYEQDFKNLKDHVWEKHWREHNTV